MILNELYFTNRKTGKHISSVHYNTETHGVAIFTTNDTDEAFKTYINFTPNDDDSFSDVANRWLDALPIKVDFDDEKLLTRDVVTDRLERFNLKEAISRNYVATLVPLGDTV